jgi:hypothetical protein
MVEIPVLVMALALAGADSPDGPAREAAETLFELKVRPVLTGTCFKCHGGKKTSGGLRVDSREALLKGGDNGPAIVPGDPQGSLLVQAIRHEHDAIKMPPDKRLRDDVVADFAAWIRQDAIWPKAAENWAKGTPEVTHWAFAPVKPVSPPPDPIGWSRNPIDRFLAAKWRAQGLRPVPLADKRTLIRRLTFDLTGLPPTPQEIADFLGDNSPNAYAKVIDRLLASPSYGERWGRHWMDVAHYADTAGDNADYPIPEIRLYRDYIIDAFNADKPYDQFVREQVAGDILATQGPRESYAERMIATGFLALSRRYATAPEELWHLTLEDTIETTGRAFLGLTLRCARCHDHKFDPVTKEDYYALYGIFASTRFPYTGSEEFQSKGFPRARFQPLLPPEEARPYIEAFERRLGERRAELERLEKVDPLATGLVELDRQMSSIQEALKSLEAAKQDAPPLRVQLASLAARRGKAEGELKSKFAGPREELRVLTRTELPPELLAAYAVAEGKPVDEAIHIRGEPERRGAVVRRNVPKFLVGDSPPVIPANGSGRLALAEWLTRPEHPLTARVMVNRIWQHHFGRGIVASPSNFGLRGDAPTHPELLDWLADRFVREGWSNKAIHRLLLLSSAYQLSGTFDPANATTDPSNRFFWRRDRARLDAEAIRDAMLAVGGHLALGRLGPHPFPPVREWHWTQHNAFKAVYASNHRSVYLMTQRIQRHPFLALFDGPDTNTSTADRTSATVPLQALYFLNNPFVREQAGGFVQRLMTEASEPRYRIAIAHELAWGRPADPTEIEKGLGYVADFTRVAVRSGLPPQQAEREAWESYAKVLLTANEFLYLE